MRVKVPNLSLVIVPTRRLQFTMQTCVYSTDTCVVNELLLNRQSHGQLGNFTPVTQCTRSVELLVHGSLSIALAFARDKQSSCQDDPASQLQLPKGGVDGWARLVPALESLGPVTFNDLNYSRRETSGCRQC